MSRKRNGFNSGKKARDIGNVGMSKHRSSGGGRRGRRSGWAMLLENIDRRRAKETKFTFEMFEFSSIEDLMVKLGCK